jgi:hypothetical protein
MTLAAWHPVFYHKIKILDVHVNKEIYQPKQHKYLGGLKRYDEKKNKDYVQYFKAWNASFNYKGFNLDYREYVPPSPYCILQYVNTYTVS